MREDTAILQIRTNPDISFLVTDEEEPGRTYQNIVKQRNNNKLPLILFAVAGSGETQFIFNFLASELGHYLVSGQILGDAAPYKSILNPRRGGASADT